MRNIAGSPVEGENFFGREQELPRLVSLIEDHDILLLGPRRIGKTSIGRALMAAVGRKGWQSAEVNVAACTDERGFVEKLAAALRPALSSLAVRAGSGLQDLWAGIMGRIKHIKLSAPGAGGLEVQLQQPSEAEDWTQVASELLRLLGKADSPWLIYVDELPIFLFTLIERDPQHGVARVRRFLDWFRNDVRNMQDYARVRWLVSGSIGLDTLVQNHGMADTINSLKHEGLEEFSPNKALELLQALHQTYPLGLSNEHLLLAVNEVQWRQPYYLQQVFHHLRQTDAAAQTGEQRVQTAVNKLAAPGNDNDFHHWETRLTKQMGTTDAAHARALLARKERGLEEGNHGEAGDYVIEKAFAER